MSGSWVGQACADLNMSWSYAMATVHPWPPPMMQPRLKLTTAAKLAGYQAAMDGAFRDKEALLAGGTALPRGPPKEEPRPGGNKPRGGEEVSELFRQVKKIDAKKRKSQERKLFIKKNTETTKVVCRCSCARTRRRGVEAHAYKEARVVKEGEEGVVRCGH